MEKKRICDVYYCYHPDFQEADNEKGYIQLPTGKWVVEWNEVIGYGVNRKVFHKTKKYNSMEEAKVYTLELLYKIRRQQRASYQFNNGYSKTSKKEMEELDKLELPEP